MQWLSLICLVKSMPSPYKALLVKHSLWLSDGTFLLKRLSNSLAMCPSTCICVMTGVARDCHCELDYLPLIPPRCTGFRLLADQRCGFDAVRRRFFPISSSRSMSLLVPSNAQHWVVSLTWEKGEGGGLGVWRVHGGRSSRSVAILNFLVLGKRVVPSMLHAHIQAQDMH